MIKKKEEDIYIAMLRFGAANIENGFRLDELVTYLQGEGYLVPSVHSTLLRHFFPQAFFAEHASTYPDIVSFFYLKPEAYVHLLNFDSLQQSKRSSRRANQIAIIAIVLNIIALCISFSIHHH
jgi:hypothetical protein